MKRKEKKNPIVSWVRFPTTKYKRKTVFGISCATVVYSDCEVNINDEKPNHGKSAI